MRGVDRFGIGRVVMALPHRAPVAELVDARDSKSRFLWKWEFESPRGHQTREGVAADRSVMAFPAPGDVAFRLHSTVRTARIEARVGRLGEQAADLLEGRPAGARLGKLGPRI